MLRGEGEGAKAATQKLECSSRRFPSLFMKLWYSELRLNVPDRINEKKRKTNTFHKYKKNRKNREKKAVCKVRVTRGRNRKGWAGRRIRKYLSMSETIKALIKCNKKEEIRESEIRCRKIKISKYEGCIFLFLFFLLEKRRKKRLLV